MQVKASAKRLFRFCLRYPPQLTKCNLAKARMRTVLVLLILGIGYLHFAIAPRVTSSYNKACYLTEQERKDMEYLLVNVVKAFENHHVTYWLEYGTMLGIWRQGEIIPYDGDLDIARLYTDKFNDYRVLTLLQLTLRRVGIKINQWQAFYRNSTVDLFRMKQVGRGDSKIIERFPVEHFGWFESVVFYFLPPTIKSSIILPTREITAYGTKMRIPNRPLDFVKRRYPLTWFISFPYKWKCFIPF